ncbi:hypothetical protein EAS64_33760 [Trebonia kvetii]|uniref:Uncharacterized protein n=1 Tax=Trebonia kvetii TaxID=2480626 RepID=A0A6P2BQW1_9ACTN|nr:hypothetical protein [Trebonia kvetii]TVZ01248.1 hypothetical protein EAS64_33760 [Trebonia kvetii]
MPSWLYTIDLADIFHADIPFEERRDEIVKRIRESEWYRDAEMEASEKLDRAVNADDFLLGVTITDLEDASDEEDFDWTWDEVYDMANADRAWINTL